MVEKRPIPSELSGHWGFNTIDAYAVVLMTRNQQPEDIKVSLATQIASTYSAGLSPDVPRWFADGAGHWLTSRVYSREDSVKQWEDDAEEVMANMRNARDLVSGNMPAHKAALVSYLFVKKLRSKSGNFKKLLRELRSGSPFEEAFATAFGQTPAQMMGAGEGDDAIH